MKTTIEISSALFEQAKRLARKKNTTLRNLVETGLTLVLKAQQKEQIPRPPPLVTFKGGGLRPEFADASWERLRTAIYPESSP
ncbi:MAG: type II toxin-antitoxin system VapB family antitoxin [Methylacidiphilales bacterium]|nr:type II toxin-antitoxin system VapB family antitoxin [Candidatus Methylacidiphilales bacterium]